MHTNIQLLISGLGSGGAYALLALGLVLIFRGSGVLNFGHGAIASVSAYTYLDLVNEHRWGKVIAAVATVALAAFIGVLFQVVVIRKVRHAPALARVVATVGLLVTLTALIPLLFGDVPPQDVSLFPTNTYTLPVGNPHYILPADRAFLAGTAVVASIILWAVYRYSTFGRATRAVALNERAAATLGYSPQLIAAVNWGVGSALAGFAGVALAGLVQQTPTTLTLILVAAIAASLLGGFRSFALTLVASLALAEIQSILIRYSNDLTEKTTIVGWGNLIPFVIILLIIVVRGAPIPVRGSILESRLPLVPVVHRPVRWALIFGAAGAAFCLLTSNGWANALTITLAGGLVSLSLVVVTGFVGQVSLLQMSLAGVGAFFASKAATVWHVPFPLPILVGAAFAVPIGVVAALPALRVRGIELAVVTMGAAFAADAAFFSDARLSIGARFPSAHLFGVDISGVRHPKTYALFVLAVFILLALGVAYLRRSPLGARFLAVRANERGASALGISIVRSKLSAFAIAAFLAGAAGGLLGYQAEIISFQSFLAYQSLVILAFSYLGGIGAVFGACIAGANFNGGLFSYLFYAQGTAGRIIQVIGGVGVMMVVVLHPDGVALLPHALAHRMKRKAARSGQSRSADPAGVDPRPVDRVEVPS